MARVVKATTGCVNKATFDQCNEKLVGGLAALAALETTVADFSRVTSEQEARLANIAGNGSQSLQDMSAECIERFEKLNAESIEKLQSLIETVDRNQTERAEKAVNDLHHFHAEFAQLKVSLCTLNTPGLPRMLKRWFS
eukprot:COSAG05_NODE_1367_length_5061_cov_5.459291_2_plen_139_part_00